MIKPSQILLKRRLLKQPRYLYRYSSLKEDVEHKDVEHKIDKVTQLIDILKNNRLYCAAPSTFNDPFDVRPAPSISYATDKFRKFYFNYGTTHAKNIFKEVPKTEDELHTLLEQGYARLVANPDSVYSHLRNIGICCLSEEENNLLMWAHYTSGHNGYRLKFESPKWSNNESLIAYRVEYRKLYPEINIADYYSELPKSPHEKNQNILFEFNRSAAMIKSQHWKYEKEWRLIQSEPGYVNFNRDSLKEIALGINVHDSVVEIIVKTAQEVGHSIKILRAELDKRAFKLNYAPIVKN